MTFSCSWRSKHPWNTSSPQLSTCNAFWRSIHCCRTCDCSLCCTWHCGQSLPRDGGHHYVIIQIRIFAEILLCRRCHNSCTMIAWVGRLDACLRHWRSKPSLFVYGKRSLKSSMRKWWFKCKDKTPCGPLRTLLLQRDLLNNQYFKNFIVNLSFSRMASLAFPVSSPVLGCNRFWLQEFKHLTVITGNYATQMFKCRR